MDTNIVAKPIQSQVHENQTLTKTIEEADYKKNDLEADKDIPVSLFEARFHKPYAAQFFGIQNNVLTSLDTKAFQKMRDIDEFIIEQMHRSDLKDSQKSYNSILNKLITILGIDENTKSNAIIDKIHQVILLKNFLK